jgi:choline dehydrogenase
MDMTVHHGQRWSASQAYLHPALRQGRRNLRVHARTLVHRVLFENGRAVGVQVTRDGPRPGTAHSADAKPPGTLVTLRARKEVILCGGAINSPQLLQLSGVGDAALLRQFDIPVLAHRPGVGQNLQDHLDLYIQVACTQPVTLHTATWRHPHKMLAYGAEWLLRGTGKAATSHLETGGFIRTRPGLEHPDLQFHFLSGTLAGQLTMGDCHGYQV